jgi:hypothetical protein
MWYRRDRLPQVHSCSCKDRLDRYH